MFNDYSFNPTEVTAGYGGAALVKDEIEKLAEFQKSFYAGSDINIADLTGGQAGRVQNMESTFKSLTFKEESAAFWRAIPKDPVDSTVLEWARIIEVGGEVFYEEAGDVDNQADRMDRQYDTIKFMGVKGKISMQAKSVKFLEAAEIRETKNKTLSFIRGIDLALWFGDKVLNPLQFDGLFNQVIRRCKNPSQTIIDLRGKRLSDTIVNQATTVIADNYGNLNGLQFWMPFQAAKTWVDDKMANKMFVTNFTGGLNQPQLRREFEVENGKGIVQKDVFMRAQTPLHNRIVNTAGTGFIANHTKAPSVPKAASLGTTVEATTTAYEMPVGDYDYAVTSFNEFGESAATEFTASVVAAGQQVSFNLEETTPVAGQLARGYRIYRRAGASTSIKDYYLVKQVAGGANLDDNHYIPGTTRAALIDWDSDQVLRFAQLLPMFKLYYGITGDFLQWLQKLYGALQVYNPDKIVIIDNIGDIPNE